jgi:ubiquitin conjugation factor E4 B
MEINKLQSEPKNPALILNPQQQQGDDETPPHPGEREALLATTERQATSYISLSHETVALLSKFTAFVPQAFVYPEVVDRLASMLNFNQVVLVGDKCKYLKVKDPSKYRFQPKELLSMLVDIYLHSHGQRAFIVACAADGRSYRREVFEKTCGILKKYLLKGQNEIEKFEDLAMNIEEARLEDEECEEALGDIPDEFLGMKLSSLRAIPIICVDDGFRSVDVYAYEGSRDFASL